MTINSHKISTGSILEGIAVAAPKTAAAPEKEKAGGLPE